MSSISFDRAAEFYDRTRVTDDASIRASVDLLAGEFLGRGRVLEIGVGTGALAVPLASRGVPVVGVDLSAPMLAKLGEKDGTLPILRADATHLPFVDRAFGGAYARHVLHLIPDWRRAVDELCRAAQPGGAIVIEPGGYAGEWRTVWLRLVDELGPAARPVGLDMADDGAELLDQAFADRGATSRDLPPIPLQLEISLERFFEETRRRVYSWTWSVDDADLERAVPLVREWARARYGDLAVPFAPETPMRWRAYDLASDTDRPIPGSPSAPLS